MDLPEIVRTETREVIEEAIENGLIGVIDPARRDNYINGKAPIELDRWAHLLVAADGALNVGNWFDAPSGLLRRKGKLYETKQYLISRVAAGATPLQAWQEVLHEVVKQQKEDVAALFRVLYERDYPRGRDTRIIFKDYVGLARKVSDHFKKVVRKKQVIQDDRFLGELDALIKQVHAGVRTENETHTLKYLDLTIRHFQARFEYSTKGLGLIRESIEEGFKEEPKCDVQLAATGFLGIVSITADGKNYLEHHMGKDTAPSTTVRAPNAERGTEYVYVWWLFDDEESYKKVAAGHLYPRDRGTLKVKFRESGKKEETLTELFAGTKKEGVIEGNFLGARDMVNREQLFTDEVRPIPQFTPNSVIALGAARLSFYDLANKEMRLGNIIHWPKYRPGMSALDLILAWARESKIRWEPGNLEWKWTRWDGELPIQMGTVKGRVVDGVEVVVTAGRALPCANDGEAEAIYQMNNVGLNHGAIIEYLDGAGNPTGEQDAVPTDAEGRFEARVAKGKRFRVIAKDGPAPFTGGVHTEGWPVTPILEITSATPLIEHVIVPKKKPVDVQVRIVDRTRVLAVPHNLPCADDAEAQAIYAGAPLLGLNGHEGKVIVGGAVSATFTVDAQGRDAAVEVPVGVPFEIISAASGGYGDGHMKEGWPVTTPYTLTFAELSALAGNPKTIIVPKEANVATITVRVIKRDETNVFLATIPHAPLPLHAPGDAPVAQQVYDDNAHNLELGGRTIVLEYQSDGHTENHVVGPDGRIEITTIRPNDPFRIKSPGAGDAGYNTGKHEDGYPDMPWIPGIAPGARFDHILVPKPPSGGGGGGGAALALVRPDTNPNNGHNTQRMPPFGHTSPLPPITDTGMGFECPAGFHVFTDSGTVPAGGIGFFLAERHTITGVWSPVAMGAGNNVHFTYSHKTVGVLVQTTINYDLNTRLYHHLAPQMGIKNSHLWFNPTAGATNLIDKNIFFPYGTLDQTSTYRLYCIYVNPGKGGTPISNVTINDLCQDVPTLGVNPDGVMDFNYFEFELM